MVGCDLTIGLTQSKSRALVRDRFRQFPVATRFDTLWAMNRHLVRQEKIGDNRVKYGL
jgi:hypothetical protein